MEIPSQMLNLIGAMIFYSNERAYGSEIKRGLQTEFRIELLQSGSQPSRWVSFVFRDTG